MCLPRSASASDGRRLTILPSCRLLRSRRPFGGGQDTSISSETAVRGETAGDRRLPRLSVFPSRLGSLGAARGGAVAMFSALRRQVTSFSSRRTSFAFCFWPRAEKTQRLPFKERLSRQIQLPKLNKLALFLFISRKSVAAETPSSWLCVLWGVSQSEPLSVRGQTNPRHD